MKKVFCILLSLLSVTTVWAQDRPACPKESMDRFRGWFRTEYLSQFKKYKKEHRQDYRYKKGEFKNVSVTFYVDTVGCLHLMKTDPGPLSEVQTEVLNATLKASPRWTPAVQNGRKVRMAFTLPVRE